jgi:hypothetical protein
VGYGWIMGLLSLLTICLLILLKFAIDAVLIHKSHSFTTAKMLFNFKFYSILFLVCVALYSLIGKYEWKVDAFRSLITVVEENHIPSPDRADILAKCISEIKAKAGKSS